MPPAKNALYCPVKIVVYRCRPICECVYVCVCRFVFVCKITNNLRSLRSSLIWYYYFGAPQMKRYYVIALCWSILWRIITILRLFYATICFCCCCWLSHSHTLALPHPTSISFTRTSLLVQSVLLTLCCVHTVLVSYTENLHALRYAHAKMRFIHTLISMLLLFSTVHFFGYGVCIYHLDGEFIWMRVESWRLGGAVAFTCVLDKRRSKNSIMRTQTNT